MMEAIGWLLYIVTSAVVGCFVSLGIYRLAVEVYHCLAIKKDHPAHQWRKPK